MPSILIAFGFDGNPPARHGGIFIFHRYGKRKPGAAFLEFRDPVDYFIRAFLYDEAFPVKKHEKSIRYYLDLFDKIAVEILLFA